MKRVLGAALYWLLRRPRAAEVVLPPRGAGTIAEFHDADALTEAVRAARAEGWTRFEAYAPHPVPDAAEAMGIHAAPVGWIAAGAGVAAMAGAYGLTMYLSVVDYPVNVGGRPPHAWPVYLPAAYIVGVLVAALAALLSMLWLNGLPRLHHPVFAARGFLRASEDRFFLWISPDDPMHTPEGAQRFLRSQAPLRVSEVPPS
ncbi:DUF3341 domain-containing protein [Sabulicella rubraurantiaca]|uniref:DUF3341 domain-containing protein n=1 Tax=Sabulicella rubraurantiaca TaxID=2811429 RepID=UPI001A95CF12|nr:DUF3341 domain-containing protein [Sabulicella rubraurantiaca]